MSEIRKYPRTPHFGGSRVQPGDEDLATASLDSLKGRFIVVEEKVDGANAAISFAPEGQLQLQSRGHFLIGGHRERHFGLFKGWATSHKQALWQVLGNRYILYGEWLYAKHTIFYDELPHYFLEFDILDTVDDVFLSTAARGALLNGLAVASVPVLWSGEIRSVGGLSGLIGKSLFKSAQWRDCLHQLCIEQRLNTELVNAQTDSSDLMEGLYIKVEDDGEVIERYKYVRASFLTSVLDSDSHWLDRPIIPNQLREGSDIFAGHE